MPKTETPPEAASAEPAAPIRTPAKIVLAKAAAPVDDETKSNAAAVASAATAPKPLIIGRPVEKAKAEAIEEPAKSGPRSGSAEIPNEPPREPMRATKPSESIAPATPKPETMPQRLARRSANRSMALPIAMLFIAVGGAAAVPMMQRLTMQGRVTTLQDEAARISSDTARTKKWPDEGVIGACPGTADRMMLEATDRDGRAYRISCGDATYDFALPAP